jgi:hypothetical protein
MANLRLNVFKMNIDKTKKFSFNFLERKKLKKQKWRKNGGKKI